MPASADCSVYVFAVAPVIAAQALPCASQRCHWYVNVGLPLQVPAFAVSTCPTCGVPLIVGGAVLLGPYCACAALVCANPVPAIEVSAATSAAIVATAASSRGSIFRVIVPSFSRRSRLGACPPETRTEPD